MLEFLELLSERTISERHGAVVFVSEVFFISAIFYDGLVDFWVLFQWESEQSSRRSNAKDDGQNH